MSIQKFVQSTSQWMIIFLPQINPMPDVALRQILCLQFFSGPVKHFNITLTKVSSSLEFNEHAAGEHNDSESDVGMDDASDAFDAFNKVVADCVTKGRYSGTSVIQTPLIRILS